MCLYFIMHVSKPKSMLILFQLITLIVYYCINITTEDSHLLPSGFCLLKSKARDLKTYFQLPFYSISFDGGNFISEKGWVFP